jgi:hypothetical protein
MSVWLERRKNPQQSVGKRRFYGWCAGKKDGVGRWGLGGLNLFVNTEFEYFMSYFWDILRTILIFFTVAVWFVELDKELEELCSQKLDINRFLHFSVEKFQRLLLSFGFWKEVQSIWEVVNRFETLSQDSK